MMNGRILFLDQSGQIGGAELCLADVAGSFGRSARVLLLSAGPFVETLRSRGLACAVLPVPGRLAAVGKSASAADLISTLPRLAWFLVSLRREIRSCDILYLNTAKALLLGVAACAGRPSVFHLHDLLTAEHFSPLNLRLIVSAANRTRGVIANSRATAEAFRNAGGRVQVRVIPNGFDPGLFSPRPEASNSRLRASISPSGRPVAAVFGRISRWKGQDVLLRAAAGIPELEIWIVGEAVFTGDDKVYAGELQALASTPELKGRVFFLGHRMDVPELMQAADIIVHSSVAPEPFGRVVVEGMLSARPVVAARCGGPAEILSDGETGFLFEPGSTDGLSALLRRILSMPDLGCEMGLLASEAARQQYALPSVLEMTRQALADMIPQ